MSGIGHISGVVPNTGNALINGILAGNRWTDAIITYGFPDSTDAYGSGYPTHYNFIGTFSAMTAQQRAVSAAILDMDAGDGSYAAFSFEGITGQATTFSTSATPHIRAGNADAAPNGWGYFPNGNSQAAGDFFIGDDYAGTQFDARNPVQGNYSHMLHMHEIGHALGLHHPHHGHTSLIAAYDSYEFTVMSYRSYVGGPLSYIGGGNEFPQSFMMLDIQALQHLYGANFDLNSGDTVYSWTPDSGETLIDGVVAISPITNRIFATLWDGGGTDTFDLSAYQTDLAINLNPGEASQFSAAQTANLGNGHSASGNIYNAFLYQGDTRSLIENVIGGSGNDSILGNAADNVITGSAGQDSLTGNGGRDSFVFGVGHGDDVITDFSADDYLIAELSPYLSLSAVTAMMTQINASTVVIDFGLGGTVTIEGVTIVDITLDNFIFTGVPEDGHGPFQNGRIIQSWDKTPALQKPFTDLIPVYEPFNVTEVKPDNNPVAEPIQDDNLTAQTMQHLVEMFELANFDNDILL